jgi:hypothetical protein
MTGKRTETPSRSERADEMRKMDEEDEDGKHDDGKDGR